jgi:hypothetical protein
VKGERECEREGADCGRDTQRVDDLAFAAHRYCSGDAKKPTPAAKPADALAPKPP